MDSSYIEINKKLNMNGIKKILFGYVLVFANILLLRIGNFDVFPDFIGYFIIMGGLSIFIENKVVYKKAKNITTGLLILAFLDFYQYIPLVIPTFYLILLIVLDILKAVLSIFLMITICKWIIETAEYYNQYEFAEYAGKLQKIIIYSSIAAWIIYLFMRVIYSSGLVFFVYTAVYLVTQITLILLLKKSYDALNGKELTEYCSKV